MIAVVVACVVIVILSAVVIVGAVYFTRRRNRNRKSMSTIELTLTHHGSVKNKVSKVLTDIVVEEHLGGGNFGRKYI